MNPHWSLLNLDIIGFASVLETPVLPRVLAPVFRDRTKPETVLLPPFTVVGDEVFNAGLTTMSELDSFVAQKKVTLVEHPIAAKVRHELWVDDKGAVSYSSKPAVKQALEQIFSTHLAAANDELAAKHYDAACEHAAVARAVMPAHIDPLVIRAAAELMTGQTSRLGFTKDIARHYLSPAEFDQLVQERAGGQSAAEVRGATVMKGAAVRRPKLQAA
jgi:hypothetical protein